MTTNNDPTTIHVLRAGPDRVEWAISPLLLEDETARRAAFAFYREKAAALGYTGRLVVWRMPQTPDEFVKNVPGMIRVGVEWRAPQPVQTATDAQVEAATRAIEARFTTWLRNVFSATEDPAHRKTALEVVDCIDSLVYAGEAKAVADAVVAADVRTPRATDETELEGSAHIVSEWLDAPDRFPIPDDAWGADLHDALRTLVDYADGIPAAIRLTQEVTQTVVAERDRLERNLSALLCELTGGRLSKTNYDVRTMVQEVEQHFQEDVDVVSSEVEELKAALEVERARVAAGLALADELIADAKVARAEVLADERQEDPNTEGFWYSDTMRDYGLALRAALSGGSDQPTEDNPEHDPGERPNHRPGSFLDRRDRRGLPKTPPQPDPIERTTGATCLGNIDAAYLSTAPVTDSSAPDVSGTSEGVMDKCAECGHERMHHYSGDGCYGCMIANNPYIHPDPHDFAERSTEGEEGP